MDNSIQSRSEGCSTREPIDEYLLKRVGRVKDFPKEGIEFLDISTILARPGLFEVAVNCMEELVGQPRYLVAMDARGFVFGAPIAHNKGSGLVMCRKAGKLPAECYSQGYDLEYGSATLQIEQGLMAERAHVVIIDDLLATGGTAEAAIKLCQQAGVIVDKVVVFIELEDLGGRKRLKDLGVKVESVIKTKEN